MVEAWLDDGDVRLYHGDALDCLCAMPSESVQCIVTSPPFWALRDYGEPEQIGLEATPELWCQSLVEVFRECRRVLRSDGCMWLECGDTYNSGQGIGSGNTGEIGQGPSNHSSLTLTPRSPLENLKHKDLVGAPWLLAFALRADGWYLRSDTIWARPNPMPESVTDRPTKAHSYVFLLTKSARYFFDSDAIREPQADTEHTRARYAYAPSAAPKHDANADTNRTGSDFAQHFGNGTGRNARSVWSIPTEPTPFAHFATFPTALVDRCIRAGTSEHGACSVCGAPWRRITETSRVMTRPGVATKFNGDGMENGHSRTQRSEATRSLLGWEPSCDCRTQRCNGAHAECAWYPPPVVPCVVLDPFMGSGTTALTARRLGRHAWGIELNAEYLAIAAKRLQQPTLWSEPV